MKGLTAEKMDADILGMRPQLQRVQITKCQDLPIEVHGASLLGAYLLDVKLVREYQFPIKDYRLDFGGDLNKIKLGDLSSAIDSSYRHNSTTAERFGKLTASAKLSGGYGPLSGEVKLEGPADVILEMLGVIDRAIIEKPTKIVIAIKGYADGEKRKWDPPVESIPKDYQEFSVVRPLHPDHLNWVDYDDRNEAPKTVKFPYSNSDLPDLRAQFVRKEFVDIFVEKCAQKGLCTTYILDNKPLEKPDQSEMRKVQIFLLVYGGTIDRSDS